VLRHLEQQQAYLASAAAGTPATAAQQQQPDPANVAAALSALQSLLTDPQLLVDLFVNFDCDLQAANLFERTMQVCFESSFWFMLEQTCLPAEACLFIQLPFLL
jgi:hypothetical protein